MSTFNLTRLFTLVNHVATTVFDDLRLHVHALRKQMALTATAATAARAPEIASVAEVLQGVLGVTDAQGYIRDQVEQRLVCVCVWGIINKEHVRGGASCSAALQWALPRHEEHTAFHAPPPPSFL